ncbi:MAG: hypothetical protein P1Q69_05855, partial [Candidatus Thorarchaeota archaeon]|nr:hypothetical protein [Candidatus Thorarchaeota archaeon]
SVNELGITPLDPYQAWAWRIEALEGDRLEGNVTSQRLPIHVHIYQDAGYEELSSYQIEDAIYSHFGMVSMFNFISSGDTTWLLVLINDNNLTQETLYYCRIYDSPVRVLIAAALTIVPLVITDLFIITGSIVYYRKKH